MAEGDNQNFVNFDGILQELNKISQIEIETKVVKSQVKDVEGEIVEIRQHVGLDEDEKQKNVISDKDLPATLTVYERHAKENGISVKISAKANRDLPISPQDLVIIIANLFENAIHAATKLKSKEKHIDIYIKDSAQRLLIKVENSCRANLTFDESLWGVGIRSVISTTNKYDGMYDFFAADGTFSAKISLNLN